LTLLVPTAARSRPQVGAASSVSDLVQKIQEDKVALAYDESHGYLRSLLKTLDIPVSSQTLVFSKSSLQLSQIAPEAPRAVYFNDDVYMSIDDSGRS